MGKLLYEEESYQIRGACFEVWNHFGSAFKEGIIQKALVKEFKERNLSVEQQKQINILYKGEKVGSYVPDFVINDKIIMEIKVKPMLLQEDKKQFWYYLRGSNYKLGFLINFGTKKLEIVRRVYDFARLNAVCLSA
ncbi:MAG: GxxExxY protein [Candidatus Omnitrophica bacterium]|jgi:hypothetical protein|nr:GxxExxY protein [Candidatus Omnitrophota bacterium]